jgi:mono/diheme cytochrome c family protein
MAATDQLYRNQKTLDVVFAVSCVLMLIAIIGMFTQDYFREFKTEQRSFRDVEEAMAQRALLATLPNDVLDRIRNAPSDSEQDKAMQDFEKFLGSRNKAQEEVEKTKAAAEEERKKDEQKIHDKQVQLARADTNYRGLKATYDSKESLYNIAADESQDPATDGHLKSLKEELDSLRKQRDDAKNAVDVANKELADAQAEVSRKEGEQAKAEENLKKEQGKFLLFQKLVKQKGWKWSDWLLSQPVIDAFASPYKIQQYTLAEYPIDYSFKYVTRYDRCTTCHLGMEKPTFDKASLASLTQSTADQSSPNEALQANLSTFRKWLAKQPKRAEDGSYARNDKGNYVTETRPPSERGGYKLEDLPTKVIVLPESDLTTTRVNEYAAHPRLDLFVDANSPHPAEKFGCTSCHSGQGSATDFQNATHTPNNAQEQELWDKHHGWTRNHFWDYPQLAQRFTESTCLKCHHQVTDLIRYGNKEEAPKLLRGYNLVRENGCFGCHEIAGMKNGREIGPDLRLEPGVPLEHMTALDRAKVLSDAANPPGTMRKVGPSLYRLSEKANADWVAKWIRSPRGFRHDTRMPHFYGLANNNEEVLQGSGQEKFPDAEIQSITAYLLGESKSYLTPDTDKSGNYQDVYRRTAQARKAQLDDRRRTAGLTEGENKELAELEQRLNYAIAPNEELKDARDRPLPIAKELKDSTGKVVQLPAAKQGKDLTDQIENGRNLFTVRGCLACHSHPSARKEVKDREGHPLTVLADSEANFGPNLGRIALKLGNGEPESARRWLVQWIMNPNVHHPRTRMPITHLEVDQANDVAVWLLSTGKDNPWDDQPAVAQPDEDTLRQLTRVYLPKAWSKQNADDLLEPKDDAARQRAADFLKAQKADADERVYLEGNLTPDRLKLYVGKKAISRLGCFGCHNIPGFEAAKPIGTALNDWGKKDPERLAFEDGAAYVADHYSIAEVRVTREDLKARVEEAARHLPRGDTPADKDAWDKFEQLLGSGDVYRASVWVLNRPQLGKDDADRMKEVQRLINEKQTWHGEDGKPPYEKYFAEALEHHLREGFLHQKLAEPRSYDYNRRRDWDDRLRMPQFQFARKVVRRDGESTDDFEARKSAEEAEAREAVMTFVLGLVAEPVPAKYLNNPGPDRLAEVKGRQVIEKFNCAGCHLIRPGVYEFKAAPEFLQQLAQLHQGAIAPNELTYPPHDAWEGLPAPWPDRLLVRGVQSITSQGKQADKIRLADALRFPDPADGKKPLDLPASTDIPRATQYLVSKPAEEFGGTFADLMVPYLMQSNPSLYDTKERFKKYVNRDEEQTILPDSPDARIALPPSLLRQGEKTQPDWLFRFLLNPIKIRPTAVLRMPRFNMSEDEAQAIVNYFAASDRLSNPGSGLTYPYAAIPQRDERYWHDQNQRYLAQFKDRAKGLEERAKELQPFWEQAAKDPLVGKDAATLRKEWEESGVYAADAFRLLTFRENACAECHPMGTLPAKKEPPLGPNLDLTAQRLRPDWTERWLGNPERMHSYYLSVMPKNIKKGEKFGQTPFEGPPLDQSPEELPREQARALRDVLLDFGRVSGLPENRYYQRTPGGK